MRKLLLFAAIMLAGCSNSTKPVNMNQDTWQRYSNTRFGYDISIPMKATGKNTPIDAWAGFGTYSTLKDKPTVNDYQIGIRAGEELPPDASCSPSLMGASKTSLLSVSGDKGEWGKVDWLERWKHDPPAGEGVYCLPNAPATSTYILCSEKNARTVVVCINQVTDNPTLAEEIFNTFRWTK